MTLRRRIATAVAAGSTIVVLIVGAVLYATVGNAMRHEIDTSLRSRAKQVAATLPRVGRDEDDGDGPLENEPPPDLFGGANGTFQSVSADGSSQRFTGVPQLPITKAVLSVARTGRGSSSREATVAGQHLRILTVPGRLPHTALEVARPLTEVDAVQSRLLVIFGAAIGLGLVLSAALGGLIGTAALTPVARFTDRSERALDLDGEFERLDESGPAELGRLAASFNRALVALDRAGQAQRSLVADASHELRTPVAAVRSDVEILLDADRLPPQERISLRQNVLDELDDLTDLVSNVVELARPGAASTDVRDVALDAVIHDAVHRVQRRSAAIEVVLDISSEYPAAASPHVIRHVPDRVERAVANLLDNARRFTPPGGTISVRLRDHEVEVIDDGPGFEPGDLEHVFDRFWRADSARSRPGSGLGLAIVRQTALMYGGDAGAANAAGRGARVWVRFRSSK